MCQPSGWHFYKRGTGYLPFTEFLTRETEMYEI